MTDTERLPAPNLLDLFEAATGVPTAKFATDLITTGAAAITIVDGPQAAAALLRRVADLIDMVTTNGR